MKGFEDYIRFFNSLKIDLKDITTLEEKQNFQKVVIATYTIESKKFETNKLYYKRVTNARNVKNAVSLESYFNDEVYWLDIDEHEWPQSSGETDIDQLIIDDITDDSNFKHELLQLANNQGTGFIQLISKQGRSNQYYRNFENNNHWHDIILLIKAIIDGETSLDPYLKPLVFRWDGNKHTDRLRVSLSWNFGSRAILYHLIQNISKKKISLFKELMKQEQLDLLRYKKQIILQGPPGTGKTKLAKELGKLIASDGIEENEMDADQLQIVQFHPSYTYEDFVRGIVIQPNESGTGLLYDPENKVFGNIIELAKQNLIDSKKDVETISKENWVFEQMDLFVDSLKKQILATPRIPITQKVDIVGIEDGAFRYKGKKGWSKLGNRMLFEDIVQAYLDDNTTRQHVKLNPNLSGLANWHATYYIKILNDFRGFLTEKKVKFSSNDVSESIEKVVAKNYVLIIDEINRANLPSVLGELIYALEYRGEKITSMYGAAGEKHEIQIPENLFVIGTMNTADRSVAQIDYAIRRRFAFVDILPEDLTIKDSTDFKTELFKKVAELFVKTYDSAIDYSKSKQIEKSSYLSEEFNPKEVWLGHSYFIQQYETKEDGDKSESIDFNLRLQYEIKPILREYVKDGILKESALAVIEDLVCSE